MTKSEQHDAAQRIRLATPLSEEELDVIREEDDRRGPDEIACLSGPQEHRRRLLRHIAVQEEQLVKLRRKLTAALEELGDHR